MEQKMSDIVQPKSDRDEDPTLEPIKLLREMANSHNLYLKKYCTKTFSAIERLKFASEHFEYYALQAKALLDK